MQMCCWQTSVQIALAASGGDLPFGQLVVPTSFAYELEKQLLDRLLGRRGKLPKSWIQEMAEQDASMQEYMTANDEAPLGDAGEVGSGGDAGVVAQLQARILELESQQVQPDQGRPPRLPLQFEPPARDPVQGALFGDLPRGGAAVSPGVLKQLQSMAGPAPSRLSRLEAKRKVRAEPTLAQHAQAELDAGVLQEEELAALAQGGDPLHRILALQLQQTAALSRKLTSKLPSDPITSVLGSEGGNSSSNGVRGCVAREAYLRALEDIPGVGRVIMMNAAADLGLSELQIGSGSLGDHRLLTYMAQFMACSWQTAYDHQDELALGLFARGLVMIEQIALDKGRCQFGWLLTGLTEPDLAQISMHKQRLGIKPYAKLAAAPWVAANVAYLRDIDFLETRLRSSAGAPTNQDKEKDDTDPKAWRKKKRGQSKEKEDSGSTTAAWTRLLLCMTHWPMSLCFVPVVVGLRAALGWMLVISILMSFTKTCRGSKLQVTRLVFLHHFLLFKKPLNYPLVF